ncbi:hypothetical protein HF521_007156 [Silurus meridionalis]|uniref:Uncharacterized protein n=1 Tax=Silurus meridionalis TaxID=175797 RepID=A0A8T0AW02_SILME|nr:hypothetical protein HF521_007156 [Silurus meridionalis]
MYHYIGLLFYMAMDAEDLGRDPECLSGTWSLCCRLYLNPPKGPWPKWPFGTCLTAFPMATSSLKLIGDLQALSVAPSHLEFASGMASAFLYLKPAYVPTIPSRPVMLQALCPPPFLAPNQEKQNQLCPVRADLRRVLGPRSQSHSGLLCPTCWL